MASKSKNKGKRGERELSKILSDIFHDFGNFGRVVGSGQRLGGKNWSRNKDRFNLYEIFSSRGDIIPPPSFEHFVFECKFYSGLNLHLLLKRDDNKRIISWIEQARTGITEDDIWFLCMKFNNQGWFLLLEEKNFSKKYSMEPFLDLPHIFWKCYYIFSLEDFFHVLKKNFLSDKNEDISERGGNKIREDDARSSTESSNLSPAKVSQSSLLEKDCYHVNNEI